MTATALAQYSQLRFEWTGDFTGHTIDGVEDHLLAIAKRDYVRGCGEARTLERFEMYVDVILRFRDRINFDDYRAWLNLKDPDCQPYVPYVEAL